MYNNSPTKNLMPIQDPKVRIHNFDEVTLGYTKELAIDEANRCLNCKNAACVTGCPVNIHIPDFIEKIKEGDIEGAYGVISLTSALPSVCGRVCPQENQCEEKCVRGIKGEPVAIGRLERFVADEHRKLNIKNKPVELNGKKIAIVGSGPSGLTCAGDLAKLGYDVTVYEALHTAGGVLAYGIPQFRLPKEILKDEVNGLKDLGVKIEKNVVIGKTLTVDELKENFDAVYIGTGAGLPNFMNIKGESLNGVYSANEYLTRVNLMKAYLDTTTTPIKRKGKVAVVGGGNVAMDAARTALRLGADKVYIVYRRSMVELPAKKEEVEHAIEEGIDFRLLNNPVEIIGENGYVAGMKCIKMKLGDPDEKGRRRPVEIPGSEFILDVDCVVMAIGTSPNPLIKSSTPGLEVTSHGCIIVDDTGKTSKDKVYAGGDVVTGSATVISAMGAGKLAAKSIHELLSK